LEDGVIAALYVRRNGHYFGVDGVDPWDEARDARLYTGPWPVVAHPPCQRWGKMSFGQPLAVSKGAPKKQVGDDGGCLDAAYAALIAHGGVMEHPRGSKAWRHLGLTEPPDAGGWIQDGRGGWTCCVEQGRYGHYARKATWLLVYGVDRADLPELQWGLSKWEPDAAIVARMGMKRAKRLGDVGARGGGRDSPIRIDTPPRFRNLLLSIARSTHALREAA
jgi:hypothetical protein